MTAAWDAQRDEMRRARTVAAIDYCDSTHQRALHDALCGGLGLLEKCLKTREIVTRAHSALASSLETFARRVTSECVPVLHVRNSSEHQAPCKYACVERGASVCKLNLRDMGATSGEVYSHSQTIERQVKRPHGRPH